MSAPTRRDLQSRIKELEAENEELQSRIDEISDIVTPAEEYEDEEEGDDDEEDQ